MHIYNELRANNRSTVGNKDKTKYRTIFGTLARLHSVRDNLIRAI